MSTLLSVVCHDLDPGLTYTDSLGHLLCCTKEGSGDAVSTPASLAQVHPRLHPFLGGGLPALSPGTAHTSLWGWHRESFPGPVFMRALHCEVFMDSDPHQPGPGSGTRRYEALMPRVPV